MNVTLRQLRVFIEVARLQSFSRAGDEIGLTQSAVSRCVRELEGEIGLKLVDRTTREVQLTDVGANLEIDGADGGRFRLLAPAGAIEIASPLRGRHNVMNVL